LNSDDIRALLDQAAVAASPATRGNCPSAEELADAAAGRLDDSRRPAIAAHVAECADCAEEYRLAQALRPWAESAAGVRPRSPARPSASATTSRWRAYALAASVLLAIGGAAAWFVPRMQQGERAAGPSSPASTAPVTTAGARELESLRQQLADTSRRVAEYEGQIAELRERVNGLSPQVNVAVIDLEPDTSRGAADPAATTIDVPADAPLLTLILTASTSRTFTDYAIEIVDRGGKQVWTAAGLKKSRFDTFTVALPRRLLPDGLYLVRTFAIEGGRRQALDQYAVELRGKVS
jgi:hypothetical protein